MNKSNKLVIVMSVVLLFAVFVVSKCFFNCNDEDEIQKESEGKSSGADEDSSESSSDYSAVVVLDAGHGGADPGKVGVDGQLEKEINLQITLKLKEILENDEEFKVKVILTRTDDNGLYSESDSNKKMADMKKRCEIANSSGADIVVSVHQNSYHSSAVKGAQVFYYKDSENGKVLAGKIQNKLVEELSDGEKGRVEKANDNYYLLLNVDSPAVIVECGFLSNPGEAASLADSIYQERIATAVADGIKEYLREVK